MTISLLHRIRTLISPEEPLLRVTSSIWHARRSKSMKIATYSRESGLWLASTLRTGVQVPQWIWAPVLHQLITKRPLQVLNSNMERLSSPLSAACALSPRLAPIQMSSDCLKPTGCVRCFSVARVPTCSRARKARGRAQCVAHSFTLM